MPSVAKPSTPDEIFNSRLCTSIRKALELGLGETGAEFMEKLMVREIKKSFKVHSENGIGLTEMIGQVCLAYYDETASKA